MSGVEVVGIVLGAIPLFISAAEHYRDGFDSLDKFFKKERILKLYIQELETHKSLLRLQLQNVVGNTDLTTKIQQELVDSPESVLWQEKDVQYQLQRSLGEMSGPLQKIMERMAKVFTEQIETDITLKAHYPIRQSLHSAISQPQCSTKSGLRSFSERVRFSWKSPKRNEILLELRNCNDHLYKMINAVKEARPYQKKQQVRKAHVAWQSRKESHRLFDVLTSRGQCSCQPPHQAKLRIRPCTDGDEDLDYGCLHFHLSFMRTVSSERAVTVQVYRKSQSSGQNTAVKIAMPGISNKPDKTNWKAVKDICATVDGTSPINKHVALAIDEAEELWEMENASSGMSTPIRPSISLQALFPTFTQFANKRWLWREKLIFAVISAYSALQLYDSPWTQEGLSAKQLLFTGHSAQFGTTATIEPGNVLGQPYIIGDIGRATKVSNTTASLRVNMYLAILGIMLLELHLNQSIQSPNDDLQAVKTKATSLLEDHYGDCTLSECYYEAVRFCLFPKPDRVTRVIEFSDRAFREVYYNKVILPLEEELHENFEIDQKFWDNL